MIAKPSTRQSIEAPPYAKPNQEKSPAEKTRELLAKAAAGVMETHIIGQAGQHRRIVSL
jgi:hypothetical protein